MNIVFVQAGLGAGGSEKIINLLAHHFCGIGHDVTVLALNGDKTQSYFEYGSNIRVECRQTGSGKRSRALKRLAEVRWLRKRFREAKADVVVSFLTKVNLLASIAAAGTGIPVIAAERNNPIRQMAGSPWRHANALTAVLADRFVMQTTESVGMLSSSGRRKSTVIPNPCMLDAVTAPKPDGPPAFVAVGRLDPQKGFDLLIEAFGTVSSRLPEATLTIFGEGKERAFLERRVEELGLGEKVSLPGTTDKPGSWAGVGNVFVLSSRYEGFPNVLVEAMSAGYPVISFDCPWGPGEILSDPSSGILVPDRNKEALAEAMLRLGRSPGQRAAFAATAPVAVSRFALPEVLAQWEKAILPAARQHGAESRISPAGRKAPLVRSDP
jgi:glycosyltransferase involved in cell wall biosynthesis